MCHLAEEAGDVVAQTRDKAGDGGEVRGAVAREGDEGDMFAAGALDAARADDALAVGEEDDLEQHSRWVGGRAGEIVAVAGIKAGEVESAVDQMMQRVLERAGQQLPLEIDGDEARADVDVLIARHAQAPFALKPYDA